MLKNKNKKYLLIHFSNLKVTNFLYLIPNVAYVDIFPLKVYLLYLTSTKLSYVSSLISYLLLNKLLILESNLAMILYSLIKNS